MRASFFVSFAITSLLTFGVCFGLARADDAGDKQLAAVEAALNRATTHKFEYEALTEETGRADKKSSVTIYIKGEKRLAEFTAPADMKGTKVLILSPSEMYVYLPSLGKVRRITSHGNEQGAFGMAFSLDDLATQKYAGVYAAVAAGSKLTLTIRAGQTTPYRKIELTLLPDKNLPSELKYYDLGGKLIRTELRSGYTCGDGDKKNICTPSTLRMIEPRKGIFATRLVRKSWKVNEPIAEDVFSKRNLEK